jgi:hypothetical protein
MDGVARILILCAQFTDENAAMPLVTQDFLNTSISHFLA